MDERSTSTERSAATVIAAAASMGAGAVHIAAIGAHAEHPAVVKVFLALGSAQILWGVVALARPGRASRVWSGLGVVLGGAAVVGWLMAKTSGISWVDGLEEAEPTQWADGLCAALAAVAAVGALWSLGSVRRPAGEPPAAGDLRPATVAGRRVGPVVAALVGVLSLTGMNAAAVHVHAHGDDHDHAATDGHDHAAADGHDHATTDDGHADGHDAAGHDHAATTAVPYDPTLPIDLSGVDGVTPQQQARAENLVAVTLARLPQFADPTTLEARGYHSINDAGTGYEHFVNWDLIGDGRQLDPDHPESVVFRVNGAQRTLVSAMFFAEGGVDLDHVPDIGGALTQWHIHDNLCFAGDPPRVAGLTIGPGACPTGTRTLGNPVPMIHVWIVPHPCGPFAALEGVAAGQVKPGETTRCDHAHGSSH